MGRKSYSTDQLRKISVIGINFAKESQDELRKVRENIFSLCMFSSAILFLITFILPSTAGKIVGIIVSTAILIIGLYAYKHISVRVNNMKDSQTKLQDYMRSLKDG